ncbi:phospholipase D-like domain-containing protein [Variovorax sp. RA8]|uniref:phospholipase D-like domain-containing protein n=1 Tax=Variovorax sp. (strain JCM 16519 / RA8) TaxID=662548 RepID=UPI000A6B5FE0|nr:phospholipase D-like domain-containing protein [Variovorax sp. RA8]VTU15052.1 putative cardiolipin synthase YwiE [Variovorax sp. RA8]
MGPGLLDWLRSGWALLALATLVVVLGLVIWSIRRHRDPRLVVECDASIADLLPSLSGLTQGTVYEGNAVELLENGAFFDAMFEEIAKARASVHFETFLWKEGKLGERLANALIERRRAGVKVRVLVDADGGKEMGRDAECLRSGDCNLRMHHPRHIRNIGVFNDRDHRKLLVVDGRVAMVGGHCIVDSWLGNGESREHVRDLGVRLRGPIVHAVQGAFSENWVEDTGELFVGDEVFPPLARVGEVAIHVASLKPEGSPPAVKILHHLVPCIARKRIWIQNPYFLPDSEAIEALCDAAKRGVDVRVMVPSAEASDMPMVQHAAHRNFHLLLAGGVRIFEYSKCLLHQKVMTVDTAWCAIGSSNFDDRSFETNDEITLGLRDDALAAQLEAIFERDMHDCSELNGDAWARRGLRHRCKDNLLYVFNELL